MLKKKHININEKDAAASDFEVVITTTKGENITKIYTGYTYDDIFDRISEEFKDENSIAAEQIVIRFIR